ncbi:TetR family transcriptional regulator [Nocardia cyriacigeorgica]|uniref:TetR family transcriptional regulator n=1 Tax=Nocardia cyriacigeorgica TaxID=135487 RepID=UPI001894A189|nr:TetR family transcriptional regulator [Nocardia cyriacigeorgica]MBF6088172.1 TetR family transcriptional regulator [Nocardia cyriacigeorgica]MBF6095282.1 TetR family transcriptional regulator [Nocardia cyriacigeorgica]
MRAAGEATRERILAAAKAEFAQYGIAGARINRIATAARASKDRLYAYFPGKRELYIAVTERWTAETTAETALRADDVPGYVGRLFDHFVANPDNARLQAWSELEPADNDVAAEVVRGTIDSKLAELRRGQQEGLITADIPAPALLRMLTDLARTSAMHAAFAERRAGGERLLAQRAATVLAAQRLVAPHRR